MRDIVYCYKSKTYFSNLPILDTGNVAGIRCCFHYNTSDRNHRRWVIEWPELEKEGIINLAGMILVKDEFGKLLKEYSTVITSQGQHIMLGDFNPPFCFYYEYSFAPTYLKIEPDPFDQSLLEKMFQPSEKNDAILLVEKQQLHVNKTFLSYHSNYFCALFSSNFKEGQMDEIPINDITIEEISLVLSTIHPDTLLPVTDKTVEKLLELADRFIIPSVLRLVETHLLAHSEIGNDTMLWLADKYRMMKLLNVCILRIDTVEKAKKLQLSLNFNEISDETNANLFKRLLIIA